jgi:hypothetical protein
VSNRRIFLPAVGATILLTHLSISVSASPPAPLLTISTRDGYTGTLTFSDFDEKHLTLKLKADKQGREFSLREIASIAFTPTDSTAPEPLQPDSLDSIFLRNGNHLFGVFRRMDDKHTYVVLSTSDEETSRLDNTSIRRIAFGNGILDVDRREFGKGFNLFGQVVEVALGVSFASDVEQGSRLLTDTMVTSYVNTLGRRIAAASKRPGLEYSFEVINSRVVNAFTVGGGRVFVYRGLLEGMSNEAELAGVLAHEIGHNVGKHTAKQLSEDLLMQGIISGSGALIYRDDQKRREAFEKVGGVVAYFTTLKFSRDDEREADFLAVYNLYQLGYDPRAMVSVFETLRRGEGRDPSSFEVFFQTHPSSAERIENVGVELPKLHLEHLKLDSPQFQTVKAHLTQLPWPILRRDLVNEKLQVAANSYSFYTLSLDSVVSKDCVLKGHFIASGGSGNDIRILLFDSTNFLNWKNNHEASVMYQSGAITAADMSVPITQPGQYYLVLDNKFSLLTDKVVTAEVFAEYKE